MNYPPHNKGFTLVELLIAFAVVAVLMVLVSAGLSNMRKQATSMSCLNQMRQIGAKVYLYLGEHQQRFFRQGERDSPNNWIKSIHSYESPEAGKGLYKCPADKTAAYIERTYRFNASWGDSGTVVEGVYQNSSLYGQPLFHVRTPSRKIMVFCVAYSGPAPMPLFKVDTDSWTNRWDKDSAFFGEYPRLHGSDRVNLLFVDGHAESAIYPLPDAWYHFDRADQP